MIVHIGDRDDRAKGSTQVKYAIWAPRLHTYPLGSPTQVIQIPMHRVSSWRLDCVAHTTHTTARVRVKVECEHGLPSCFARVTFRVYS